MVLKSLRASKSDVEGTAPESGRREKDEPANSTFIVLEDGQVIVDSGASQAIVGLEHLERLTEDLKARGLAPVWIDKPARPPRGIGGQATLFGVAMIPVVMGGKFGVIEFVITKEDQPPLLPGGFLESSGAVISYPDEQITLQHLGCTVPMERSGKSHRTIRQNDWRGLEK